MRCSLRKCVTKIHLIRLRWILVMLYIFDYRLNVLMAFNGFIIYLSILTVVFLYIVGYLRHFLIPTDDWDLIQKYNVIRYFLAHE